MIDISELERTMPVRIKVMAVTMDGAVLLSAGGVARWVSKGDVLDIPTPSAPAGGGNRWEAFSDEEVKEFLFILDKHTNRALPDSVLGFARTLADELRTESNRRRGGYQGPGVYEKDVSLIYDVLGRVGVDGAVVLRSHGAAGDRFYLETWDDFNAAYRYLRALED